MFHAIRTMSIHLSKREENESSLYTNSSMSSIEESISQEYRRHQNQFVKIRCMSTIFQSSTRIAVFSSHSFRRRVEREREDEITRTSSSEHASRYDENCEENPSNHREECRHESQFVTETNEMNEVFDQLRTFSVDDIDDQVRSRREVDHDDNVSNV